MIKHVIETLEYYPDNGKHLECLVDYPFQIRKGEDGYYYKDRKGKEHSYNIYKTDRTTNKWIVHLTEQANPSLVEIFDIKVNKDLDVILKYCVDIYKKSLKMEIKRLEKELKQIK